MRKCDTRDMMEMHKYIQNIFIIYIMFLISCSLIGWHNINTCNKIWRLQLTYLYYIVHINVICTHTNMNTTNNVTTVTILLWANRGLRGTWGIDWGNWKVDVTMWCIHMRDNNKIRWLLLKMTITHACDLFTNYVCDEQVYIRVGWGGGQMMWCGPVWCLWGSRRDMETCCLAVSMKSQSMKSPFVCNYVCTGSCSVREGWHACLH